MKICDNIYNLYFFFVVFVKFVFFEVNLNLRNWGILYEYIIYVYLVF